MADTSDPSGGGSPTDEPGVVLSTTHDGLARTITIPGGPLTLRTADELVRIADDLVEQRDVRAVLLSARTSSFCDGPGDDLDPLAVDPDPPSVLARLRPPVVVAIAGRCLSVGLELALAADIRVAAPTAELGFDDLAAGRLPCWGGTQRLSRAVRPSDAAAMVLLGTRCDGSRAAALGLVHLADPDPLRRASEIVDELVSRGPLALELAKEAVHRGAELPLRDGLRLEGDLNHQLAATEDRAEGLRAFFDKRPPDFSGR